MRSARRLALAAPLLLLLLLFLLASSPGLGQQVTATASGVASATERLVYDIRWGPFPAGQAVLDVRRLTEEGGGQGEEERVLLELRASTEGLFSRVYPLQVRIRSLLNGDLRRTLDFHKLQNGKQMRIVFDWRRQTAQTQREGEFSPPVALPDWALDPLGLIMYLRQQALEPGERIEAWFTDGKRLTAGNAGVIDEEAVETAAGAFNTVVLRPDLRNVGGEFAKSRKPRLTVWLSDDARRLPVRVSSKLRFGQVVGELVSVEALPAGDEAQAAGLSRAAEDDKVAARGAGA